jgi:hypothetical protein
VPYIAPKRRSAWNVPIKKIVYNLSGSGDLNYVVSRIVAGFIRSRDPSYDRINAAIGALECVKQELYRRLAAPYEDTKIAENGDIPEYRGT